jgi:hypothetical protein
MPLLTDAAGSTAPLPATDTTATAWPNAWEPVLLVVVICALVITGVTARRRRTRSRGDALPAPGEPAAERETSDH